MLINFTSHYWLGGQEITQAALNERFGDEWPERLVVRDYCDADGTRVIIQAIGTSEYATCQRGHSWQRLFQGLAGMADWAGRHGTYS